jgi:hypothetical protein
METRYKRIAKIPKEFDNINIVTYVPVLSDLDYSRGYIVRYFIQKANDNNAPIFEIKKQYVSKYRNNPFYRVAILDWMVSGEHADIKRANSASVSLGCKDIPNLYLYLPNLLQFCKM